MKFSFCFNLKNVSIVVASLNALGYLVAIMWDVIYLNEEYKQYNYRSRGIHGNSSVHCGIILLLAYGTGLCSSALYLKGLREKRHGLMKPLLWVTTACIAFTSVSFLCFYHATLVRTSERFDAIIFGFTYFLALGLFILCSAPLLLTYQQIRQPICPVKKPIDCPEKPVELSN
ncbi:uncharacterized protein [Musca autumnalis]|uniref:uncharacterized protein n=1 Tax=Musca autumnalis TaxID=221902 RepID=UPI003CF56176